LLLLASLASLDTTHQQLIRTNKCNKHNNQTQKAHGQSALCIKQANIHRLLLIGHDQSECCCVDDVVTAAQNNKSQQQMQSTQQSNATSKGLIIPVHKTIKQARFAANRDHSRS
jgi:hypothetical protein